MNSDELEQLALDAESDDRDVHVRYHHAVDDLIEWVEIDGEEFHNTCLDVELDGAADEGFLDSMWRE